MLEPVPPRINARHASGGISGVRTEAKSRAGARETPALTLDEGGASRGLRFPYGESVRQRWPNHTYPRPLSTFTERDPSNELRKKKNASLIVRLMACARGQPLYRPHRIR
jgi:hypothetical protein